MNTYYIAPQKTWAENIHCFHPLLGSAILGLADDQVLVSAHFLNHSGLEHWESRPGVIALPHPSFQGTQPLDEKAVAKLASMGIVTGHTILDVAALCHKRHPLMKLRDF